jgi:putative ABC transport system substrate-binding protein
MRRRQFATFSVAGAALVGIPTSSRAQQPQRLPRIGWLWPGHSTGNPQEVAGFLQGLKEFGYIDQQNVFVDYRFGDGHYDGLSDLAAELLQLRPDVLVAVGPAATTAIKETTGKLPIVSLLGDPVGEGFVASLARPGGNITGVSMIQGAEGLTGKRIELLNDALPAATRIGMLFNPDSPGAVASIGQAQQH